MFWGLLVFEVGKSVTCPMYKVWAKTTGFVRSTFTPWIYYFGLIFLLFDSYEVVVVSPIIWRHMALGFGRGGR